MNDISLDIETSPTKKTTKDYSSKEYKYLQDVRQTLETRNIKSTSDYFNNKKVSIYDFELKKNLGEGKFGVVFQAFHKQTRTLYALKKISKKVIKSNLMVDQFLQEIKIQSFCNHENILKVYGFFDDSEHVYLTL
jgi:preprotein translocase subunit SecD